ncbi:putative ABC transport system permease protein [Aquimarina amphilecti]|uniref:Putative ABC transport system permease protein n=1 Tax=Aquimarina amphilecti TaxID=1038014 RepID=A0A1H7QRR0_AQUAM|nr:ABC transporter permease [Aquimarina amphilecti]SEL49977.1 putative ABC transport system permease protein [Aquimarina amphilecti]
MIRNYLKIAWRNLIKNKGITTINTIGLSLGIGCFILIALFVTDELSFDQFHKKADHIYRINSDILFGGTEIHMAVSSDPMGATLKKDYPEVEEYTRIYASEGSRLIRKGTELIEEFSVAYVDSTFFNVFTFPALKGNPKTALQDPNTIVISEKAAIKYFGSVDQAMGEILEVNSNGKTLFKVTAVIKDMPKNSHFHLDFLISMANVNYDFGNYLSHNFHTYIVLKEGTDYKEFTTNFKEVVAKYLLPQMSQYMEVKSMEDIEASGNKIEYSLVPLKDIHLHSSQSIELSANGSIKYVYIFSAVALFILLIACTNFMNLTTARSSGRAKEVGIRKVLGTEKKSLIFQFLSESTLVVVIAHSIAILFVFISLDWFNNIAGKEISIKALLQPQFLIFLILLPFVVGPLAGIYPAFFLSKFQPITVLKGNLAKGMNKNTLRNFLVIFQFTTSIVLIIGTIVVYQQLKHIQTTDVGFNKDQVLIVENSNLPDETRKSLKSEITQLTEIKSASFAGYIPVSKSARSDTTFSTEIVATAENGFNMQYWRADYEYIETMGMEIMAGRNFSRSFGTDSTAIILNEKAVALTGFKNPIGKKLYKSMENNEKTIYTIIGVVKNFNFESLRQDVGPLSLRLGDNSWRTAYRFNTTDVEGFISKIQKKYEAASPEISFTYSFLDDSFLNMYRQEKRIGTIALIFTVLAVIIAALGLFGLATYIAEQRTKEIGIRKVLGASTTIIVKILSKDFIKLIVFAFLIATPIAWWFMSSWLRDFAFRIQLNWWVFALTGIITLLIAVLTLSFQTIKAAITNPINSLKTE